MFESVHDQERLARFLNRDPYLYLYCLGDLEEFYWKHTVWYGHSDSRGELEALVLGYFSSHPVFLAHALRGEEGKLQHLLALLQPFLPSRFHLHLSHGLSRALPSDYKILQSSELCRMAFRHPRKMARVKAEGVRLTPQNAEEVEEFYRLSYPGNWFEARMLESGKYFAIRREGRMVAVAGVHVYSPERGVAALGNIATHPEWRGRGLASAVTAKLCRSLLPTVRTLGLNVVSGNEAAKHCYHKLGFETHAYYEELSVSRI